MDRENGREQVAVQSSIALLQERFRQLEREKESRKSRELVSMKLSESERFYYHISQSSKLLLYQSEVAFSPPKHLFKVSLSMWPSSEVNEKRTKEIINPKPLIMTSFNSHSLIKHKDSAHSDVDTSLHL